MPEVYFLNESFSHLFAHPVQRGKVFTIRLILWCTNSAVVCEVLTDLIIERFSIAVTNSK